MSLKTVTDIPPPEMPLRNDVVKMSQAISVYFNELVYEMKRRGEDVVTLSLGEAFFDIPMMDFSKLDFAKGCHYSDSLGLPELRSRLASYYRDKFDAAVSGTDDLLISAGSKPLIYMIMLGLVEVGEEILIPEPAWVSYSEQARMVGATPKFIPYNCPVDSFSHYFNLKTRMLIINNPNNPAGRLYSEADLNLIYNLCRPRGIYVLVDEVYNDFILDDQFCSMIKIVPNKDGVIVTNSLSKNMGISGWRIGYAIATPMVIKTLLKINQHLITCAPTLLLQYCAKYFDELLGITLPQVQDVVKKRTKVDEMLKKLGISRVSGSSTFYFFVNLGAYEGTSMQFALSLLLEHNIAVVPGSAYGHSTDRFVRLSVGAESLERVWESLLIIKRHIETKEYDHEKIIERLVDYNIDPNLVAK